MHGIHAVPVSLGKLELHFKQSSFWRNRMENNFVSYKELIEAIKLSHSFLKGFIQYQNEQKTPITKTLQTVFLTQDDIMNKLER